MNDNKTPEQEQTMRKNKERKMALRKKISDRAFLLTWQFIFTILIPAMLAVFLGKKIDHYYGKERFYTLILITAAFVFSWAVIIIRYKKYKKFVINVQNEIKMIGNNNDD